MPDGLSGEEQAIYFSKVRKFFDSYACSRVMERRKKMSEECLKCEYATYDCQSYGACRKQWFLDRLDRDLEKDESEEDDG